jgi:high-affinity nickel-transport protein
MLLITGLLLGLLLGMRHALEPDHLAAVSVLVTRAGRTGGGAIVGAVWGLGHSLALFMVGCVLAAIGTHLPPRLADGFELLVAAMLMTLGARAIYRATWTTSAPLVHTHPHPSRWGLLRQPLVVGLIHGLAGSGALTTLAVAALPTVTARLLYIGLFGLGSVIGMAALTGLAGWPLARLDAKRGIPRWMLGATGGFSLLLGLTWGWSALRGVLIG